MDAENLLIEKAKSGHEDSFSKLIYTYKNYIFAIILNFIKDYNEVENVAQEVCLQIYISLPNYDQQNFKGWIGRIATNKSIDWLRRKKAKFKDQALEDDILERLSQEQKDSPEILLLEKERREELYRALSAIPDIYRISLEKFYFEDKSYEDIADEENVSTKTIASRLYRGKILLKEQWRNEDEAL
ncbi:MAG TPA: sigma-70 family RNA polymerase sigma factor [Tissierellaceae bacterium]|nr:sigma-70 family RNA polymerase sigma factor [Tissierellaceae bacterium]